MQHKMKTLSLPPYFVPSGSNVLFDFDMGNAASFVSFVGDSFRVEPTDKTAAGSYPIKITITD